MSPLLVSPRTKVKVNISWVNVFLTSFVMLWFASICKPLTLHNVRWGIHTQIGCNAVGLMTTTEKNKKHYDSDMTQRHKKDKMCLGQGVTPLLSFTLHSHDSGIFIMTSIKLNSLYKYKMCAMFNKCMLQPSNITV